MGKKERENKNQVIIMLERNRLVRRQDKPVKKLRKKEKELKT